MQELGKRLLHGLLDHNSATVAAHGLACLALVAHVHGNGIQLGGHVIPLACMILDMLLDVTMLQTPQPASLVGTAALQAA